MHIQKQVIIIMALLVLLSACSTNNISSDILESNSSSSEVDKDNNNTIQKQEDSFSKSNMFRYIEIATEDLQIVPITLQDAFKLDLGGWAKKKIAVINGSVILADDKSGNGIIYQYDADTLIVQNKLELPYECTIGFAGDNMLVIHDYTIDIYNSALEQQKSVDIAEQSIFREDDSRGLSFANSVVIDENHIAWLRNDRTVFVINIQTGEEKQIDSRTGGDGLPGLFHAIYATNTPEQILISGSLYDIGDDPSVVDETKRVNMIGDIKSGFILDTLYTHELIQSQSILAPNLATIYKLPQNTIENYSALDDIDEAVDGIITNFNTGITNGDYPIESTRFKIIDLRNAIIYEVNESDHQGMQLQAACLKNGTLYAIVLNFTDESTYLFKITHQ